MVYKGKLMKQLYPDGLFTSETSESIHDFMFNDHENGPLRGIAYSTTKKTYTFIGRHESIDDILNTTGMHEPVHLCISDMEESEEGLELDIMQEHNCIRNMAWMDYVFDKNTYFSIFEGKEINPGMKEKEYKEFMKKENRKFDKIIADDLLPI